MDQNNQNNNAVNNNQDTVERTFSQEEVNRIVSERLARDRDKRSAELDEREKAVKARELAVIAAEKLAAAGLPKDLTAVLKYDDEASLDAAISQLSNIKGFKTGKKSERIYIENRLSERTEPDVSTDGIRDAFRPPNV